ncbi:hypothetical protein ACNS7O_08205 [Haloferacaceae archaeon DSL9]
MRRRTLLAAAATAAATTGLAGCLEDGTPDDGGTGDDSTDGIGDPGENDTETDEPSDDNSTDGDDSENGDSDETRDDQNESADDGGADDDGNESDDGGEGDEDAEIDDSVADSSFEWIGECRTPGEATIDVDGERVTIAGCIQVENGCAEPALASATETEDGFRVVVATVDTATEDEACTEAIEFRGYEAIFEFEDAAPDRIEVVHDSAEGESTVATTDE